MTFSIAHCRDQGKSTSSFMMLKGKKMLGSNIGLPLQNLKKSVSSG